MLLQVLIDVSLFTQKWTLHSCNFSFSPITDVIDYIKEYLFGSGDDDDADDLHPKEAEEEYVGHDAEKYEEPIDPTPPESFRPLPITDQDPPPKASTPTGPPKPFKSKHVLSPVDRHAIQVRKQVSTLKHWWNRESLDWDWESICILRFKTGRPERPGRCASADVATDLCTKYH